MFLIFTIFIYLSSILFCFFTFLNAYNMSYQALIFIYLFFNIALILDVIVFNAFNTLFIFQKKRNMLMRKTTRIYY